MLAFLQTNYACLIVCFLFFGFVLTDKSFDAKTTRLFLIAMGIVFCLTVVDGLELVQAALPAPTLSRRIYSAIGYALRPSTAIMIVLIMHRNTHKKARLSHILLQGSIFFINALLSFLSIFTSWVFGYSAANAFFRGPLGYFPFFTAAVYVIAMMVETLSSMRARQIGETVTVILVGVLSVLGTALESLFLLDGTLNVSCAVGIFFYYLYCHVHIFSHDLLTNAYNRRIFYLDIDKLNKEEAVLVGIDLNNLKKINDEFGHAAGDAALITLTEAIRRNLPRGCDLYRMGGDEFTVLFRHMELAPAEALMKRIGQELALAGYTFAYGCVLYHKAEGIDSATNSADAKMYEMKNAMKLALKK